MVRTETIELETDGNCHIVEITGEVQKRLTDSGLTAGTATVFVAGATGGVTTVEYEPGLVRDLEEFFDRIVPQGRTYHHNERWQDGNGHSHVRASLLGPSLTVPFADGQLILGTWQQIIFLDFDNKPRRRRLIVQIMGE